jgi:hypothetical protein
MINRHCEPFFPGIERQDGVAKQSPIKHGIASLQKHPPRNDGELYRFSI